MAAARRENISALLLFKLSTIKEHPLHKNIQETKII